MKKNISTPVVSSEADSRKKKTRKQKRSELESLSTQNKQFKRYVQNGLYKTQAPKKSDTNSSSDDSYVSKKIISDPDNALAKLKLKARMRSDLQKAQKATDISIDNIALSTLQKLQKSTDISIRDKNIAQQLLHSHSNSIHDDFCFFSNFEGDEDHYYLARLISVESTEFYVFTDGYIFKNPPFLDDYSHLNRHKLENISDKKKVRDNLSIDIPSCVSEYLKSS